MIGMKVKKLFFDSKAVMSAVDRKTRKVLSRFGAFVRTAARSSIRKRKRSSRPGEPPSSHTGLLRKFIFFAYEPSKESVVIGPEKLNQKNTGAPEILEHGGSFSLRQDMILRVGGPGRDERGRFVLGKRKKISKGTRISIAARPFMGPAYEKEKPKLPSMWAGSIK